MKIAVVSCIFAAYGAEAFTSPKASTRTSLNLEESQGEDIEPAAEKAEKAVPDLQNSPFQPAPKQEFVAINGWVPDDSKPCFGLPGVVAPTGYFDPIGFCQTGISLNDVKRYREAEVQHGRVAMLAVVGYLAGESFQGPFGIAGPANDQLAQVPLPAFLFMTAAIASAELKRATIGWVEPTKFKSLWALRENYYPGDLGFDPLGLKPKDSKSFADMQTRELQNGRLAMIGAAGFCSQELVNHKTISDTIDFYVKVYSGINPYETY